MEKTNSKLNYDYLASRHIDPAKIGPIESTEYSCSDCRMNTDLVEIDRFERDHLRKNCQIPMKCHHLEKVGIIMTQDSVLYQAHFVQTCNHNVQPYNRD